MRIDTTDAFRQLPAHKRQRIALLISHLLLFVLVVYRCDAAGRAWWWWQAGRLLGLLSVWV